MVRISLTRFSLKVQTKIYLFCQRKNDANVKKEGKLFSSQFSVSCSSVELFMINDDHKARSPPLSHEDESMTLDRAFLKGVVLQKFYLQWFVMGWYKFKCLTNASIHKFSYCSFEFIFHVFFAPFNGDFSELPSKESWNVLKENINIA